VWCAKTPSVGNSSLSQCYTALPYLVDFEVARSFQEPQLLPHLKSDCSYRLILAKSNTAMTFGLAASKEPEMLPRLIDESADINHSGGSRAMLKLSILSFLSADYKTRMSVKRSPFLRTSDHSPVPAQSHPHVFSRGLHSRFCNVSSPFITIQFEERRH
jgi:hypothetical protein